MYARSDKGTDHLRNIFYRMGFNDQEIGKTTVIGKQDLVLNRR